ncbi:MAG: hypothetical protein F4X92_10445 [Gammaproteobacteria bacterium]|nr:hypothetical protein [Gammaproteobacteria bacterium]
MSRTTQPAEETMGFPVEEFTMLSNNARKFVRSHPREARVAVATALEVAANQPNYAVALRAPIASQPDFVHVGGVPESLRPFLVRQSTREEVNGISASADRLEMSRTTVYEWARKSKLIAWAVTERGLRIPATQILSPGRVVPGIRDVVCAIGDPELAWTS